MRTGGGWRLVMLLLMLLPGLVMAMPAAAGGAGSYDPLAVPAVEAVRTLDLTVPDPARQRDLPVLVYLPPVAAGPAPVILFSHGLGGSRTGSAYLGRHWAARGYVAVFLQHPGSDVAVWQGKGRAEAVRALRQAADLENFRLRTGDVSVVLDQLGVWNGTAGHALRGRLDLDRVGMSGHSFGAITTQAVSGERFARSGDRFTDRRIRAALALSPSSPRHGSAASAFAQVAIPWLLMTGTEDRSPIGDIGVEDRLAVYPALPPGGKYELVLDGAAHSAFGDRPLPGDRAPRNPNHHRAILAISTAFWDAMLRGHAAARAWLDGDGPDGPRSVLEPPDRWQRK